MSKERTSLSLDPEVASFLRQDRVNASGLVNTLVKQYMNGTDTDRQMVKLRLQQVESELTDLTDRVENKQNERDRLESRLSDIDAEDKAELTAAIERIQTTESALSGEVRILTPDEQLQAIADEHDITVAALKERVKENA